MTRTITIIGGGPSGMMAASAAALADPLAQIILLEKNKSLGRKMAITGGGRCNITNVCEVEDLIASVQRNPQFLYSAFYSFTKDDVLAILHGQGVKTKVESKGKVFPQSNKATDVIAAFERHLKSAGVEIRTGVNVQKITQKDGAFVLTCQDQDRTQTQITQKLILATGGLSAPATGSTGDGYHFAKSLGHTLTETFYPSVVPLKTQEKWVKELQGVSLSDIGLTLKLGKRVLFIEIGDMIFTHFGCSGPVVLRASAHLTQLLKERPQLCLDMYPAETAKETDTKVVNLLNAHANKNMGNVLTEILPQRMVGTFLKLANIAPETKAHEIKKEQRQALVNKLKELPLTVIGNMGYAPAVTTAGGVLVKEINPSTLESKLVSGLYFAGEVIDVNAYTGGYNLQTAYSTGYLAGVSAATT